MSVFNDNVYNEPVVNQFVNDNLNLIYIDQETVLREINNINVHVTKTGGQYDIPAFALKNCAEVLSISLSKMFNHIILHGKIPSQWKCANIIPIFKKGAKI